MHPHPSPVHRRSVSGARGWRRYTRPLAGAMAAVLSVGILGAAALPAAAAPVGPAEDWELLRTSDGSNADGTWNYDVMPHGARERVGDAWRLGRAAAWNGLFDTNPGAAHFPMRANGRYHFRVSLSAATPADAGRVVQLVGYPEGGAFGWVMTHYGTPSTFEWGITAGPGQRIRATSDADVDIVLHEVSLYRFIGEGAGGPGDVPFERPGDGADVPIQDPIDGDDDDQGAGERDVVAHLDFEDATIAPWQARGPVNPTFVADPADPADPANTVLSLEGGDTWHGLEAPASLFVEGGEYELSFRARLADDAAAPATIRFEGSTSPWPWVIGNRPLTTEWTTITETFEAPTPGLNITLTAGANDWLVDDVVLTRIGGPAVDLPGGYVVVHTWDFEDPADMADFEGAGTVAFARVADDASANGWVLSATDRGGQDWHTVRVTAPTSVLGEYRLDVTVRLDDAATGELQVRALPGFTYMGNQAITGEFADVSTGVFGASGETVFGLHVVPGDASFSIDSIDLIQVTPPPVIDEDFEFERLEWDFEDGTAQGWFGRWATDGFGVVAPGSGSGHAIRVYDRTDQGSGPMIDIDELVRPLQRLEFSADVRFVEPVEDNRLTLSIQNGPASFTNLLQNLEVDADGEWTRIEGIFVVPAFTTTARLYLESPWAQGDRGEVAAFEVDNIVIDLPAPLDWDRDLVPFQETLPGINSGVAVDSRDLIDEMGEVITHHFSHLVGENHMKPDAWWAAGSGAGTNWSDGIASFRIHPEARSIMDFAQEHEMSVFHHVMIWHSQVPDWFFSDDNSTAEMAPTVANQQEMVRRIWEYTATVAGGIAAEYGQFGSATNPMNSIEVANEVVHGGGPGGAGDATHNLRPNSPWTRIFAPQEESYWVDVRGNDNRDWFLYEAFQAADHYFNYVYHVADARGRDNERDDRLTLWINDYNTERGLVRPDNPLTKRYQLLQVTNRLLEAGAPLDGVGHQFHAGLIHPVQGLRHALDLFAYDNGYVAAPVLQAITEIDVTIPSNTPANLVAQGHYYREAFDIIRNHQLEHGDIDTVTIWGLNDGRSWRADQFPLLFTDDLTAKPAFAGVVYNAQFLVPDIWERWERPSLPTTVQHAYAFGQSIPMDESAFAHYAWDALPAHRLTGPAAEPGSFGVRWSDEALYILADVPFGELTAAGGGPGRNLDTRLEVTFEDTTAVVRLAGLDELSDVVEHVTYDAGTSFRAVIRFPLDGVQSGDTASLDLFTFNGVDTPYMGGVQASGSERGAWTTRGARGEITFHQPLAFVSVPEADTAPVLGDFGADVWHGAAQLATDVHQSGSAAGARADARALWHDNGTYATLFMLIDVDDATPDVSGAQAHEQDSVEIFVGLGDRAADGGRMELYDAQFRISRAGVETFGGGLAWANPQRIDSVVVDNGTGGYQVMVAISLRTGTGHQIGQWTNNPLNDLRVQAFDLQVNDAVAGARASVFAWANHTGEGHSVTTHWGAMQLGAPVVLDPVDPEPEPGQDTFALRRNHQFLVSNELPAAAPDLIFGFGTATDEAFLGDWDGDGVDTPLVRRGNQFLGTNTNATGFAEFTFTFAVEAGDVVLVGDWDGDGIDTLAIRRGSQVLTTATVGGPVVDSFTLGLAADEVFVGDWDGDGIDTLAIRRANRFSFANENATGASLENLFFGVAGDDILVGDFNADGRDSLALRRTTQFFVPEVLGGPNVHRFFFGLANDTALAGNLNGQ